MHLAAFYGHVEVVEALLSMGALPTIVDVHERTPAHCAEEGRHMELANMLHSKRREMGAYELGDIAHMATKGLDVAAEGVSSLWSSFNRFASGVGEGTTDRPLEPRPKMPASRSPQAKLPPRCPVDPLAARVRAIEQAAESGHLKEAMVWQDELTKVAVALDNLELDGDTTARVKRKEAIARIEEISNHVDARLATTTEALAANERAIAQVEQGLHNSELQSSQHYAEWRTKLIKIASSLDAVQCATEAQRTERKALLAKADAAEEELKQRELQA
jgi:ankyrin repeat protein